MLAFDQQSHFFPHNFTAKLTRTLGYESNEYNTVRESVATVVGFKVHVKKVNGKQSSMSRQNGLEKRIQLPFMSKSGGSYQSVCDCQTIITPLPNVCDILEYELNCKLRKAREKCIRVPRILVDSEITENQFGTIHFQTNYQVRYYNITCIFCTFAAQYTLATRVICWRLNIPPL